MSPAAAPILTATQCLANEQQRYTSVRRQFGDIDAIASEVEDNGFGMWVWCWFVRLNVGPCSSRLRPLEVIHALVINLLTRAGARDVRGVGETRFGTAIETAIAVTV